MRLKNIYLKGYKSISGRDGQNIPLGDITVLLGANGSGKSNLLSFFNMLNSMFLDSLNEFVGREGVDRLLFYGMKETESIFFRLEFKSGEVRGNYEMTLHHGLTDRLFIKKEEISADKSKFKCESHFNPPQSTGFTSPNINMCADKNFLQLHALLSDMRIYQFHDTSDTAKIKDRGYVDDAKFLHSNAGNLAAFLKMIKESEKFRKYYERIIRHTKRVMPQFGDFDFEPIPGNKNYVRLNWKDNSGNEYLFDPNQISDGSLRFIALATLLLQPPELLPKFIILDEPELGLHPAAITELAAIARIAAQKTQVILATQSTRLVDEFSLDDIVVVERDEEKHCTIFKKLDAKQLQDWLANYSLSELWEKNVLGAQP